MSDIKHRTNEQLRHDVRYNKQRANTHKLRAEAAQAEIDRRGADLRCTITRGDAEDEVWVRQSIDVPAAPSPVQSQSRCTIALTPERLERMQYHITNAPNAEVMKVLSDNLTRLLLEENNHD